ncbi:hypothetical protein GJ744_001871 [Endocarpon pusillum]|uniref:EthD domain-containing protein n=1 Tax=Endocarpon pusillum TaxID=364733 RepID=A0A8H7ANB5_9EURO|nr:hypothetical protein GJ744_001871 [Endocarpon pusillum]
MEDQPGKMLCLTIYSYKKAGLSDEEYRSYMLKTHAPPLASTLMEKYGIVGFTMTHMNSTTRPLLTSITGPHFTNTADYDVVSQMKFPTVECFTQMLADPFYRENVMPDDANFADMSRTKMSLGWVEEVVKDGKNLVLQKTQSEKSEVNGLSNDNVSSGKGSELVEIAA